MDKKELLSQLEHLDQLVETLGAMLVAYELDRPLSSLMPMLTESEELSEAEASGLAREVLRQGGGQLVVDFENLAWLARQVKDPGVRVATDRLRRRLWLTARYNGTTLARKMEAAPDASSTPGLDADALRKEVKAFVEGVARVIPTNELETDDIFSSDEVPTDQPEDP